MFDAIPMIGTGASVKLMKTLISNDDVTGADADMWLASLAFVHHPTGDMIKEVRVTTIKFQNFLTPQKNCCSHSKNLNREILR